MVRSPSGPTSTNSALRATVTGAVSLEFTAQHRGLDGATQQIAPSFFMQKSMAFRHSYVWLYQRQRVSRQRLPPSVPMLRRSGVLTSPAAFARAGYPRRTFVCSISSVRVIPAPTESGVPRTPPVIRRRALMPLRAMTDAGS